MVVEKTGNLFSNAHQAYAHGVNSIGRMDAGIAVKFKVLYPEMFEEYVGLCSTSRLKPGDVFFYTSQIGLPHVFNLVTQKNLRGANVRFLGNCIDKMYVIAGERGITDIGIPEIGCGLGGLVFSDLILALAPFMRDSQYHITVYRKEIGD